MPEREIWMSMITHWTKTKYEMRMDLAIVSCYDCYHPIILELHDYPEFLDYMMHNAEALSVAVDMSHQPHAHFMCTDSVDEESDLIFAGAYSESCILQLHSNRPRN